MDEMQKKINSLLYLAVSAYKKCERYYDLWLSENDDSEAIEFYDHMADKFHKQAKQYLKTYTIMSGIEMKVTELHKFSLDDFTEDNTSVLA